MTDYHDAGLIQPVLVGLGCAVLLVVAAVALIWRHKR